MKPYYIPLKIGTFKIIYATTKSRAKAIVRQTTDKIHMTHIREAKPEEIEIYNAQIERKTI